MDFGRIVTAMVTPFDENLQINWEQYRAIIDYLVEEQASDALVICGTTGESPTLSDEEKLQCFEEAVKHAAGRCKIIAGTGSNNTAHSIHLSQAAEKLGVDGLLLVAPYYNRPTQEGLYRHFKTVAESVSLPVMLYNVPGRTASNISSETVLRLAQIANVVSVKEASGDLGQMTEIIAGAPEGFLLYSGDDSLTLPVLAIGGHGVVSVTSHVIGREMKQMMDAFTSGRVAEAAQLNGRLLPVFKGMFAFPSPAPIKYALSLKGQNAGGVRLPLVGATEQEAEFIRGLL